ncbi:MAG: hypothetical protein ACSHW1_04615 [Yoonia sp.]
MKRVFLLLNLLPFMNAANANAAPSTRQDHVTREDILALFSDELGYATRR